MFSRLLRVLLLTFCFLILISASQSPPSFADGDPDEVIERVPDGMGDPDEVIEEYMGEDPPQGVCGTAPTVIVLVVETLRITWSLF